jgi:hypothetical protein
MVDRPQERRLQRQQLQLQCHCRHQPAAHRLGGRIDNTAQLQLLEPLAAAATAAGVAAAASSLTLALDCSTIAINNKTNP